MAFIISGLYRNMGNAASAAASAAKKAEENVMRRRQDPQGPGGTLMRQGQRPPPSSMTMRSGKKTANQLLSFKEMNSGLKSTINALIEKDGGTSKNFVLLEFRNRIQRNEALIDQLKLFNRLILDPDDTEVMAQKAKGRNFNNSRSVNRVGIWTGADNKQFPAVALQSVVGRYPGLFRQFFRENGTAHDSLLRVASASNEYNFWKYDGSRNIRMNDRGEFDTIVLLCVISPNNDTTYDLDRDNLESRDTRNRNSLYEGLLYATDKTFRMLAYKAKGKDGDLSGPPVARPPVTPPSDEDGYKPPDPRLLAAFLGERGQSSEGARQAYRATSAQWAEVGRQRAEEAAAAEEAAEGAQQATAAEKAAAEEQRRRRWRAGVASNAQGATYSIKTGAIEGLPAVATANANAANSRGAAAAVRAARDANASNEEIFRIVKQNAEKYPLPSAENLKAMSKIDLIEIMTARGIPYPKTFGRGEIINYLIKEYKTANSGGGSRRTKKRKIERTRRRNKKYGR